MASTKSKKESTFSYKSKKVIIDHLQSISDRFQLK